jgi:hypothetical protein
MNIVAMTNPFLRLASRRDWPRRIRAVEPSAKPGRAWINGREVGGTDARFAHLSAGSD